MLKGIKPVVFLFPYRPSRILWEEISIFPEVYFVEGTSLHVHDLLRAGIKRSSTVVILSNRSKVVTNEFDQDRDAVLTYVAIKTHFPKCRCLVELANKQSMELILRFEQRGLQVREENKHLMPGYMAGRMYDPEFLDSFMSTAFFNTHNIEILRQFSLWNLPQNSLAAYNNIFLIDIPQNEVGKTYEELFCRFIREQEMLMIGIYRTTEQSYVYTNPLKDTILQEGDKVYVLSPSNLTQGLLDAPNSHANK